MRYIFVNLLLTIVFLPITAQKVTNVEFWQEGKKVNISYNLDESADVCVSISTDGGKTFSSPLKQVAGDIKSVTPGKKTIVWDVLSEQEKLVGENICFRVTAFGGKRSFTVKGVTFNMIGVEGGTFTMGATHEQESPSNDEKPTHLVALSSYYIGETEVTQELWQAVMGNNPSHFKSKTNPVENVSWNNCLEFVTKLNSFTSENFRFPTEAEWEFSARGGKKSNGYQYSGSNDLNEIAWYFNNSNKTTHHVATKVANELNIYDMSGNVMEWCQDDYGSYSYSLQENPKGSSYGSNKVVRGGCWDDYFECRSSARENFLKSTKGSTIGFRLALSE